MVHHRINYDADGERLWHNLHKEDWRPTGTHQPSPQPSTAPTPSPSSPPPPPPPPPPSPTPGELQVMTNACVLADTIMLIMDEDGEVVYDPTRGGGEGCVAKRVWCCRKHESRAGVTCARVGSSREAKARGKEGIRVAASRTAVLLEDELVDAALAAGTKDDDIGGHLLAGGHLEAIGGEAWRHAAAASTCVSGGRKMERAEICGRQNRGGGYGVEGRLDCV